MSDGLDTSYPDATSSPGLALWRVTNAWQRLIRAALVPHDVTHVQFVLLASLTWMDRSEPITQRDLATHAGTDVMMTSQVLGALEAKGLVARRQHPSDRRAISVTVTQAGAALANRANRDVERADAAYFGLLSTTDRSQFVQYLLALDSPVDEHPVSFGH